MFLIADIGELLGAGENNKEQVGGVDITGKNQKNLKGLNIFYDNFIMQI